MSASALGPQSFAFYQKASYLDTWMDCINHTYIHLYNVRWTQVMYSLLAPIATTLGQIYHPTHNTRVIIP